MPLVLLYAVPAVLLLGLEAFLVYKAMANRKRARLFRDTPVVKVAELSPGPVQVQGRVVAFSAPLAAPLSGRPCVYYHFHVQEKRRSQRGPFGSSTYWKTVINDVRCIACGVDDGTGVVGLNPQEAELVLDPGTEFRSGFWNDTPPELERVLNDRYGRSSQGLIFNKGMWYSETLIEAGGELLVLGSWDVAAGGKWQLGKEDCPLIISNESQGALLSSYKRSTLLWSVLAVLVLVLPCVPLAVRLWLQ